LREVTRTLNDCLLTHDDKHRRTGNLADGAQAIAAGLLAIAASIDRLAGPTKQQEF
jgi:hypothetical protein